VLVIGAIKNKYFNTQWNNKIVLSNIFFEEFIHLIYRKIIVKITNIFLKRRIKVICDKNLKQLI